MGESAERSGTTVNLAERRIGSQAFAALFQDGMTLVEESAAYLDGEGRTESRALKRGALTAYAQQSMRLSTRLMQLASWLLLQRAATEGDMKPVEVRREAERIDLEGPPPDAEQEALLPDRLVGLIGRSYELQRRIAYLSTALERPAAPAAPDNPVAAELGRLRTAFETR